MNEPKGYTLDTHNKPRPYKVQLQSCNERIYIGNYATVHEAVAAYREARAKYPMMSKSGGGKNTAGKRYERKRCKYCGEDFAIVQMNRHHRSCKWKDVERA